MLVHDSFQNCYFKPLSHPSLNISESAAPPLVGLSPEARATPTSLGRSRDRTLLDGTITKGLLLSARTKQAPKLISKLRQGYEIATHLKKKKRKHIYTGSVFSLFSLRRRSAAKREAQRRRSARYEVNGASIGTSKGPPSQ